MSPFRRSQRPRTPFANPARDPVDVTIRPAFPNDGDALVRLAAADSGPTIVGEALVAEVAGELWAAVSLADGRTIADPFRRSGADGSPGAAWPSCAERLQASQRRFPSTGSA